jgi:hypothetical protein
MAARVRADPLLPKPIDQWSQSDARFNPSGPWPRDSVYDPVKNLHISRRSPQRILDRWMLKSWVAFYDLTDLRHGQQRNVNYCD